MALPVFPLVVLVGVLAVSGFLLYSGGRRLRTVFHILRNDPVPIRTLDGYSGPVEIEGTAVEDEDVGTVAAPFSGTECLCYQYEVEELRQSGKHQNWETLDSGQGGVDFVVDDGTDRVRVDPEGADVKLESHTTTVDPGEELPERLARYVESTEAVEKQDQTVNLLVTEINVGNRQRFTERRLDPGEHVYVYGQAQRGPAPDWGSGFVDAVVGDGPGAPVFVVSDTNERETAWRFAKGGLIRLFAGLGILLLVGVLAVSVVL